MHTTFIFSPLPPPPSPPSPLPHSRAHSTHAHKHVVGTVEMMLWLSQFLILYKWDCTLYTKLYHMQNCLMRYTVQIQGYTHKWECECVNCACYIYTSVHIDEHCRWYFFPLHPPSTCLLLSLGWKSYAYFMCV